MTARTAPRLISTTAMSTYLYPVGLVIFISGGELSIVNKILSEPVYALPDKSLPDTVAALEVTVVDTVQV